MVIALAIIGFSVVYCYLLYPLAVWLWAAVFERPVRKGEITPDVTVVIPAHNEAPHIENKIRSVLGSDYPPEKMEVIVISDGSMDATAEIAKKFVGGRFRVIEREGRRGKPSAMNCGLEEARGDIVVYTDASGILDERSLRALMECFADDAVGCASGLIRPADAPGIEKSLGLYRRCENFLRSCESRIHSSLGATGALFAVRRELSEPLPDDTILDDLAIPLRIIKRGKRTVVEPEAVCIEQEKTDTGKEFARKIRTLSGSCQAFSREPRVLLPFVSPIWLMALSHKILRLVSPFLLIAFGVLSVLWASDGGGAPAIILVAAQAAGYGLALSGARLRKGVPCHLYTFCVLQAAAFVALFRFIFGRTQILWSRGSSEER